MCVEKKILWLSFSDAVEIVALTAIRKDAATSHVQGLHSLAEGQKPPRLMDDGFAFESTAALFFWQLEKTLRPGRVQPPRNALALLNENGTFISISHDCVAHRAGISFPPRKRLFHSSSSASSLIFFLLHTITRRNPKLCQRKFRLSHSPRDRGRRTRRETRNEDVGAEIRLDAAMLPSSSRRARKRRISQQESRCRNFAFACRSRFEQRD